MTLLIELQDLFNSNMNLGKLFLPIGLCFVYLQSRAKNRPANIKILDVTEL
jgi:hypothetical protein